MNMKLQIVNPEQYSMYLQHINTIDHGNVYPLSIAEGFQHGEIYESLDEKSAFIWHRCGFAFVAGVCDEPFLESVYELLIDKNHTNQNYNQYDDEIKPIYLFHLALVL